MTQSPPVFRRWLLPLAACAALSACAPSEFRDDAPGRAQAFPPIRTETLRTGGDGEPAARRWSQIQGDQARTRTAQTQTDAPPPKRRRGSSSPPPDPAVLPQPPRTAPLPPVPSTQGATDAFKRDLIRPEVDRMRTDDAMGRLDPLGQRDLMRRENDLRQLGDPLAR